MKLLADVANKTTQWSAIYNLKQKQLTLVMSRDYENPLTIELSDTNYP